MASSINDSRLVAEQLASFHVFRNGRQELCIHTAQEFDRCLECRHLRCREISGGSDAFGELGKLGFGKKLGGLEVRPGALALALSLAIKDQ